MCSTARFMAELGFVPFSQEFVNIGRLLFHVTAAENMICGNGPYVCL